MLSLDIRPPLSGLFAFLTGDPATRHVIFLFGDPTSKPAAAPLFIDRGWHETRLLANNW